MLRCLLAAFLVTCACGRGAVNNAPALPRAEPSKNPFGEFQPAVDVTVKVDRYALRRRPIHDTVSAQISAMISFTREHGHGEIDLKELEYRPRHPVEGPDSPDPLRFEATRLGVAAYALFPYLRLDRGPAELAEVALKVVEEGLGRDAVVQPIPDDAFIAKGDFTPSSHAGVAYLFVRSLDEKVDERISAVLGQWATGANPPRAVVLDFSECQEAVPSVAARIFDAFAPGQPALGIVFRSDKGKGVERRMFHGKTSRGSSDYAATPVFVVTSDSTNSVAEALAFALRVRRGARVLGEMTQGTGRLMGWIRLPRPEVLGVTVADLLGTDGEPLAGRALIPDACAGADGLHALTQRTLEAYRAECPDAARGVDESAVIDYVRSYLDGAETTVARRLDPRVHRSDGNFESPDGARDSKFQRQRPHLTRARTVMTCIDSNESMH